MSCTREDLKARITDVLVDEAEPSMREAVFAHAETCDSCRDDRARVSSLLGLLRESPPWKGQAPDGGDIDDALSTIQRQKIVAAARPRGESKGRTGSGPAPWLLLAASFSAVGVAVVLARRASVTPLEVEAPAPAAVTSSVHEAPAAPEGPMLPRVSATPLPPPVAPAAIRERAPMNVEVSKEAMQEFKKPLESIAPPTSLSDAARARREGPAAQAAPVPASALAGMAAGASVPGILQVEGARDPLHEGASVVRILARANAEGVACVEFDTSLAGRPTRLGGGAHRPASGRRPCAGESFEVSAGQSSVSLFAVTTRSGPTSAVIGRVTLRDASGDIAAHLIERAATLGAFASMPADFRMAYIEARLAEAVASGRADALRPLVALAEALPDSPAARDLIARVHAAGRP